MQMYVAGEWRGAAREEEVRSPYDGEFVDDFGAYDSLADLFRQICYDERLHKEESEVNMNHPRFE